MQQHVTIKQRRSKRVARIRAVIVGDGTRPRLSIFRSHTALYGQLIDDAKQVTLGSVKAEGTNVASGKTLGSSLVALCKEKKITRLVFDRGGYLYHGVVKQIADTVREGGVTI